MTDGFDLRGTTSAQHEEDPYQPVLAEPAKLIFPSTMADMWSDFMAPEYLASSETIGIPSPDLLSSAWPEFPPLLDVTTDNKVSIERTGGVDPQQIDFMKSSCSEQDNSEAATHMPISTE